MGTEKEHAVGLVVVTSVPEKGRVAVVRAHGEVNLDKLPDTVDESWPGGCRATVYGRVKTGEDQNVSLIRNAREELGDEFAGMMIEFHAGLRLVHSQQTETELITIFALDLPCQRLGVIRLSSATGGLRLVTPAMARKISDLRHFDRKIGVPQRLASTPGHMIRPPYVPVIAMFPDERDAVKKALGV